MARPSRRGARGGWGGGSLQEKESEMGGGGGFWPPSCFCPPVHDEYDVVWVLRSTGPGAQSSCSCRGDLGVPRPGAWREPFASWRDKAGYAHAHSRN